MILEVRNIENTSATTNLIKNIPKELLGKIGLSWNAGNESIEVVVLKDKNIDYNIAKLTKILLDLEKQDIHYGKIDMTFSKYSLYTYE